MTPPCSRATATSRRGCIRSVKANFLMSPPLVVAFALAGRVDLDLDLRTARPGKDGTPVYLADLWPTLAEIRETMQAALKPEVFRRLYPDFAAQNPKWNEIPAAAGDVYALGRGSHLHPGASVLRAISHGAGRHRARSLAPARSASLAIRSPPTTFLRRAPSRRLRRRAGSCSSTAWPSRTSTATVRAAATTG